MAFRKASRLGFGLATVRAIAPVRPTCMPPVEAHYSGLSAVAVPRSLTEASIEGSM